MADFSQRDGTLYVIAIPEISAAKIGFTSGPVDKRVRDLQTGCPHGLQLLAAIPASKADEREVHILLREYRVRGEWYGLDCPFVRLLCAAASHD